ncbi:type I DNA topoisomerase [Blattabacterium cuenoti]|uniref:type I DNA topoisomerase n=1 Tax=Blattabacterium cuenoti TaxID=1653831 RepID=UPI00163C7018|nr:type I DNA topoisomerase [Blattabacterium cuenoti]
MKENLVIVESPMKANTIQKFLGEKYHVVSSYGHLVDLPEKEMGIQIENNFHPKYVVSSKKKNLVKNIKSLVNSYDIIWLASDEDREGEAIAYQICHLFKIPEEKYRRIVFHEITKKAILYSMKHPRKINKNLVYAQQTRRILDRLVGFLLSPILWKKVSNGLSAGRVQSAAVRLIVEQEEKIKNFIPSSIYQVKGYFKNGQELISAKLNKEIKDENTIQKFLLLSMKIDKFFIIKTTKRKVKKSPTPPFTTSSMQQESYNNLNFSISKTMFLSQKLYEKGYITYMRTDSIKLSSTIVSEIQAYITQSYGKEYFCMRNFHLSKKFSQEAHEAIRPTSIDRKESDLKNLDPSEKKLYQLIWNRSIMSQMSDAVFELKTFHIEPPISGYYFIHNQQKVLFEGFLKILEKQINKDQLSKMIDTHLKIDHIIAKQVYKGTPMRYNEASLVKKLESLGIGRPSTYVPIISTIQKRNYVSIHRIIKKINKQKTMIMNNNEIKIKTENIQKVEKNKFFSTELGIVTTNFLLENFPNIVNYHFTADLEKNFDDIAKGSIFWMKIIKPFYKKFHEKIQYVHHHTKRVHKERFLGIDKKSNKKIVAKIARFGAVLQIGEFNNQEKPKFIPLLNKQKIDTLSLKEALKIIELPKCLGLFKEKKVFININKYNIHIKYNKKFIPIDEKKFFSSSIDLKEAIDIIKKH